MDVGAALVAHSQTAMLVKPGDRALDDPAFFAQARAVRALRGRDLWLDPAPPQLAVVALGPVGAISEQPPGTTTWPSPATAYGRDRIDEGNQLADVVAVGGGQADGERDASAVGDQMVLGARARAVDRARPGELPPKRARTCEESIAARDQSI